MRVMVFGTFDGLHPGHRSVLNEALKRGEVIAIIARDSNVEKIKGRKPRIAEAERLGSIRGHFPDIDARLGDSEDFLIPVRTLRPDLILLGYDQRLPPGVRESDLPCTVERLPAHEPEKYKSSLL